jgi:hypothetical protein
MSSEDNYRHLYPDECLVSQNKAYKFCYQSDGNIMLYNEGGKPTWSAGIHGAGGGKPMLLSIDKDGTLTAFNKTDAPPSWYWTSSTPTEPEEGPFDAVLQDDGNVVIRRLSDNKIVWSTFPGTPC